MTVAISDYDPTAMVVETLRLAGHRVTKSASGWQTQCPAHDDRNPSLSIGTGKDGRALIHCHAHCSPVDVLDALGLDPQQLFTDYDPNRAKSAGITYIGAWRRKSESKQKKPSHTKRVKTNHWDYHNEGGEIVARVVRYDVVDIDTGEVVGKTFTQHAWDAEQGRQLSNLGGIDVPLYRLPEVRAAVMCETTIYVCEGERDADSARSAEYVATTNAMGAGSWRPHHTKQLEGAARVVVISDNDTAGRGHAAHVAASCIAAGIDTIVVSPEPGCKDLTDHLAAGLSMGDLVLVEDIAEMSDGEESEHEWWDERPILSHIRQHARARMVSPDALLATCLVRICVDIPHTVTLPPTVGGRGSLNLYTALVGPSGAGKSATTAASDELFPTATEWSHIGSGEGLLHTYVQRITQKVDPDGPARPIIHQHTHAAAGIIDEVDTLTALGNRQGATLLPTIRSMWSGASVGFGYADPTKRLSLKAHTYRLGLVIGAQPTRCAALFDDADAGTPQRILWASLTDPDAPDEVPESPGPLKWEMSKELRGLNPTLTLCDSIIATTKESRRKVLRTGDTEGLDGHAQLNRIKVAAILCIVDGRTHVSEDDWRIAGLIQESSDEVREWVQGQIAAEREDMVNRRVHVETKVAVAVDDERHAGRVSRISRRIASLAAKSENGRISIGGIRSAISSRDRDLVDEAMDEAVGNGLLVAASWTNPTNGETVVGVELVTK